MADSNDPIQSEIESLLAMLGVEAPSTPSKDTTVDDEGLIWLKLSGDDMHDAYRWGAMCGGILAMITQRTARTLVVEQGYDLIEATAVAGAVALSQLSAILFNLVVCQPEVAERVARLTTNGGGELDELCDSLAQHFSRECDCNQHKENE